MVKYIRVATKNDAGGVIDGDIMNNSQEVLSLEPNSRIGLKSLSCQLNDELIDINSSNNTFTIKVHSAGGNVEVSVPVGLYNITKLTSAMEFAINEALGEMALDRDVNRGFQFRVDYRRRLSVSWRRTNRNQIPTIQEHNMTQGTNNFWHKSAAGANGVYDSYIYSHEALNCYGTAKFNVNGYISGSEFIVGLRRNSPGEDIDGETQPILDSEEYDVCVRSNAGALQFVSAGIVVDLTTTPLTIGKHSITIAYTPSSVLIYFDSTLVHEMPLTLFANSDQLRRGVFACASTLRANTDVQIFTIDPNPYDEHDVNTVSEYTDTYYEHHVGNLMLGALKASVVKLTFPDKATAHTYGFTRTDHAQKLLAGKFVAQQNIVEFWQAFLGLTVELVNPSITSHDGFSGRRRNILLDVPIHHSDDQDAVRVFYVENPVMLDVNNRDTVRMSHIHVRLLDRYDNVIKLKNFGAVLTLVVDN
jgi:hypothetical protein